MPIRVKCHNPGCRKTFEVDSRLAGQEVECPVCGCPTDAPPSHPPLPSPSTAPSVPLSPRTDHREPAAPPAPPSPATRHPSPSVNDPLIGQKLGHYRVLEPIGAGGMASVYKARDMRLQKTVALKVILQPLMAQGREFAERFVREARAAAVVEHPNVVPVHYIGLEGDRLFIAMQYVDGGTAAGRLRERGPMAPAEAARIVRDVALALGAAHAQNIVHRDIKPSNIMLTQDGRALVADFGVARLGQATTHVTSEGQTIGTPAFMSPEQCKAEPVDGRSDLYSLGVTFYQLVTGQLPYDAGNSLATMRQHVDAPVPDPKVARPTLGDDVTGIIMRLMAKRPEERYQTAADLAKALDAALDPPSVWSLARATPPSVATAEEIAEKPTTIVASPWQTTLRRPAVVGGIGLALLVIALAFYATTGTRKTERPLDADKRGLTRITDTEGTAKTPRTPRTDDEEKKPVPSAAPTPKTDNPQPETAVLPSPDTRHPTPAVPPPSAVPAPSAPVAPPPSPAAITPQTAALPRETPKPAPVPVGKPSPATEARFNALTADLEKLAASRQYQQALTKCRDAMKDSALKPFEADLRLWEQNIQACGRVLERARAGAKGLVGRQSDFEIKKGDKGRMHIPGEVEKFENDALFVRMGGKVMEIPFDQLGPNEVSRLAAEGGSESPRDRLDRAVLLFYEGLENDALKLLREVKDGDAATLASAEAIQKLVEDGAERRKRQAKEQRATELVSKVKADYDAKLWQNVLDGIAQLRKDYSDTESVKKSASDLDEKQKVAAERVKMVVFSRDHKRLTLLLADGVKMEFVLIPPGSFMMGEASASAMPVHRVTITRPFYIGIYEVTQSQWRAVVGKDKSWTKGGGDLPAMNLSWDDCYSFLSRLGERIGGGLTCRLATEAEWEYACRAGSRGAYCFGDDERLLGDYAWYDMNNVTHNAHRPVGTRKPNMWGLYDMHGNVWEWCSDWYGAYSDSPQKDPAGPSSGVARVLRGGHFVATSTSCTSGNRKWMQPQVADYCNGFRVVSTVPSRGDGVWRFLLCRQA